MNEDSPQMSGGFVDSSCCGCRLKIGRGPLLGKAVEFFTSQGGSAVSGRRSLLEAWTSAIELDVLSSGALVNKRMDLLVGSFSRGTRCSRDLSVSLSA